MEMVRDVNSINKKADLNIREIKNHPPSHTLHGLSSRHGTPMACRPSLPDTQCPPVTGSMGQIIIY